MMSNKAFRMRYEDLMHLMTIIEEMLVSGQLHLSEYDKEYDAIMSASGWTVEEMNEEIDKRWNSGSNVVSSSQTRTVH